jgi:hypothetical protein
VREREALIDPRPVMESLDGARVVEISREQAKVVILRYEWLRTMPKIGRAYYGLFVGDEVAGVACFGVGPGTASRNVCGEEWRDRTICLERGACVHWAHPHSASFLIPRACKLAADTYGWRVFYAYSDIEAGEIGTVYQACNWLYLGRSVGRGSTFRTRYRDPSGEVVNSRRFRALLKATHADRDEARRLLFGAGWTADRQFDKGKYVGFYGPKRERVAAERALRYPSFPYPKREVELLSE